jgi:hypothetical protein
LTTLGLLGLLDYTERGGERRNVEIVSRPFFWQISEFLVL